MRTIKDEILKIDASKVKLILFDLDDTLIGSSRIYKESIQSIGLNLKTYEQAKKRVKNRLGEDHVSSHNRFLYFKAYLEKTGQFSVQTNLQIMDEYEKILLKKMAREWKALKRKSFLAQLKKKYRLAIVTNETTRTQLLKMKVFDQKSHLFEFIVTSEEMGVEKPNPKIFKECFKRANVNPSQVLMIGDSLRCDLKPMEKLGAQVLGTQEFLHKKHPANAHYLWIKKLEEILYFI